MIRSSWEDEVFNKLGRYTQKALFEACIWRVEELRRLTQAELELIPRIGEGRAKEILTVCRKEQGYINHCLNSIKSAIQLLEHNKYKVFKDDECRKMADQLSRFLNR